MNDSAVISLASLKMPTVGYMLKRRSIIASCFVLSDEVVAQAFAACFDMSSHGGLYTRKTPQQPMRDRKGTAHQPNPPTTGPLCE